MRKVTIALVTIAVIAGGGAWYVLSYLPEQIRAEIEQTIASLKPDVEISFASIEIDVLDEQAVLTDVFVRSTRFDQAIRAEKATITADGDAFDATLQKVTAATPKNGDFTAETIVVDRIVTVSSSADNSGDTPAWQQLSFDRLVARDLVNTNKGLTVQTVTLERFNRGEFGRASVAAINIKNNDAAFEVKSLWAEQIDIAEMANLPRTLGGHIEWSPLNTGKAELRSLTFDLSDGGKFDIGLIEVDGIKAGRLVRLNIADIGGTGGTKHPGLSINLKKIELNDFPIITDFPTNREELISFQTRHKSLISGGFDLRGFALKSDVGSMTIEYLTTPAPKFGNTPSGKKYFADTTTRMKMSLDLSLLDQGEKPIDPVVLKLLNGGKLTLVASGRTVMDHVKKTMMLPDLTLSVPGSLSLKLSGGIGNIPLRYFETPGDPLVQQIALERITLIDLDLFLNDDGIAGRLMDAAAERQRIPRESVPEQLAAAARASLAGDGSADARALADEVAKFLIDPKSLRLILAPERPVPLMSLANPQLLQSAGKVGKVLGLQLIANEGAAR